MKKTLKRFLASFLSVLMVIGLATAASAAPAKAPQADLAAKVTVATTDTVTITKQPDNLTFNPINETLDLSGLEIKISGESLSEQTLVYDSLDNKVAPDKVIWSLYVDSKRSDGWWVKGTNSALLTVYGYQCKQFHVEKVVNGVEYGYYDQELVFFAQANISVIAVFSNDEPVDPVTLTLNTAADVTIPAQENETHYAWFKFTAPADGNYSFKSTGGQIGETLIDRFGNELTNQYIDPYATLYTGDVEFIEADDDNDKNYNFGIFTALKKDQTVYLKVGAYGEESTSFKVIVGTYTPVIQIKIKEITVDFHEVIDTDALLESLGLSPSDHYITWDSYFYHDYNGLYGDRRGTGTLSIMNYDGGSAELKVHIKYTAPQWFAAICLGGWAWLKYTNTGPFNLMDNVNKLLDYGIGNSLYVLLRDWGLPYNMISWLLS